MPGGPPGGRSGQQTPPRGRYVGAGSSSGALLHKTPGIIDDAPGGGGARFSRGLARCVIKRSDLCAEKWERICWTSVRSRLLARACPSLCKQRPGHEARCLPAATFSPSSPQAIAYFSRQHASRRFDNKEQQPSCSRRHQIPNQFPHLPTYLGGVSPCVAGDPAQPRCLCGGPRLVNVTHEPSLRVHGACAGASGTTTPCVEFGTRERLPPRSCHASPNVTRRRKLSNELMENLCLWDKAT